MKKECNDKIACAKRTSIGGQALIEGIMMRGPKKSAMAVRDPDGNIVLEKWDTVVGKRPKILRLPLIRGMFNFIDSMKSGYKCLMRSAEISMLDELEEEAKAAKAAKKAQKEGVAEASAVPEAKEVAEPEVIVAAAEDVVEDRTEKTEQTDKNDKTAQKKDEKEAGSSVLMNVIMVVAMVLAVVMGVGLFMLLPTYLYKWTAMVLPILKPEDPIATSLIKSVFEGVIRIAIMVIYMLLVSLMKDIRRTFQYHGAEHKTIFCYESGLELTVENVRKQRRFHPRCGTSFLILMLLVSIVVSFFIDPLFLLTLGYVPHTLIRAAIKILLIPLIMGIGYELIKLAGKHDNLLTRIISAPGVWLQHVTVLEPDDSMIECAITAFVEVIPEEEA